MIRMYADGDLFYAPHIQDRRYAVISPELTEELGRAAALTFTMPQSNTVYGSIRNISTTVTVEENGEIIFCGRPMTSVRDFWGNREITCEGALAWLNDSQIPPHSYSGSREGYYRWLIQQHNSQVAENRQLAVGIMYWTTGAETGEGETVTEPAYDVEEVAYRVIRGEYGSGEARRQALEADGYCYELVQNKVNEILGVSFRYDVSNLDTGGSSGDSVKVEETEYKTAIDIFLGSWLELSEGLLRTRSIEENGQIVTYLDTISKAGTFCDQEIRFAENLLDFDEQLDAGSLYTRLIPLGPKGSGDTPMTIADVNDGVVYLENTELAERYGYITKTETFQDAETAAELKEAGEKRMKEELGESLTLTIRAVDMERLGANPGVFFIGGWNRVISPPHGYDEYLQCTRIRRPLQKPEQEEYTFGVTLSGFSSSVQMRTG